MSADGSFAMPLPLEGKTIRAADLFCGAGGTSTGARRAIKELGGKMKLVAVNHWDTAITTHSRMHPDATHLCADLEHVRPRQAVPGGVLDILMASPTCTYHSRARGGRPVHDQQRMDPWHVVRWCSELRVYRLLVENVPEMVDWGPCDARTGKPIKKRKGEYFRAWIAALENIGFKVKWQVRVCADYGDATTRARFFLIARSDKKPLRWAEPSHAEGGVTDLFGYRLPWRTAAEIIDWDLLGKSIFTRKKMLAENTLRRLHAGAVRNNWPQQYIAALDALLNGKEPQLDLTQAEAEDISQRLGIPLLMGVASGAQARPVTKPAPTITTGGASSPTRPGNARPQLIEPLITSYYGESNVSGNSVGPLPTVTTKDRFSLAIPTLVTLRGTAPDQIKSSAGTVESPVPALTAGGGHVGVSSAVLIQTDQTSATTRPKSTSEPIGTVVSKQNMGLSLPFLVPSFGEAPGQKPRTHDIEAPVPAITATGHIQIATPVLVRYRIEILYRMLHWRELARAMSFDDDDEAYDFAGTATEITKQIGNAVPVRTAKALISALLSDA